MSQERRTQSGAPMPIKDRNIHYYQLHNGSHGFAPDLFIMAMDKEVNDKVREIAEYLDSILDELGELEDRLISESKKEKEK